MIQILWHTNHQPAVRHQLVHEQSFNTPKPRSLESQDIYHLWALSSLFSELPCNKYCLKSDSSCIITQACWILSNADKQWDTETFLGISISETNFFFLTSDSDFSVNTTLLIYDAVKSNIFQISQSLASLFHPGVQCQLHILMLQCLLVQQGNQTGVRNPS